MANIFTLWSSGKKFTNEDGWSSTLGALSYRGALKGLCYRSEALDQRVVVTTSENKHLIRLKRRMFVVPESVLRTATSAVMQRIYRDIPSRLPPYHWDAGSIRILSLPRGIPHEWHDLISRLMRLDRRFIVITQRAPDEITRAMLSINVRGMGQRRVYTTSNDHDITLFKLMSDPDDIIVDTKELRTQAVQYYNDVRDRNIENIMAFHKASNTSNAIAKLLTEEINNI